MRKCQNPECDRMEGHGGECRRESPFAVSDPSETLALIAEHRLAYWPWGNGWVATNAYEMHSPREGEVSFRYDHCGEGPTIDDAVRACVARAKGEQRE